MDLRQELDKRKNPIRVYTLWQARVGAMSEYRLTRPFGKLASDRRIAFCFDDGRLHPDERMAIMEQMDTLVYHLLVDEALLKQCLHDRETRPSMIFSADDDIENVSPYNPAYTTLGTKTCSGETLSPGDVVFHPDGYPLWKDLTDYGKRGIFDIARNLRRLELLKAIATESDGVIVTNEYLRAQYESYGARRILVLPNLVDPSNWPKIPTAYPKDEVRILWQGGASHYEDFWPIRNVLSRVLRAHPNVKFIYWGQDFPWVSRGMPPEQFERIDWCGHAGFVPRFCSIGHDIALAPLAGNAFSKGKTAIKWYESSIIPGHPAVTLAGAYGPFAEEMQNGVTGMLYWNIEGFEQSLTELIEDATLRHRLANNAHDWVMENRDVNIPGILDPLYDFLKEIHDEGREARRSANVRLDCAD